MAPQPGDTQRQGNYPGPVVALNGAAQPPGVRQSNSGLEVWHFRVPLGRPEGGHRGLDLKEVAQGLGQTNLRIVMVDLTDRAEESDRARVKAGAAPAEQGRILPGQNVDDRRVQPKIGV